MSLLDYLLIFTICYPLGYYLGLAGLPLSLVVGLIIGWYKPFGSYRG